MSSFAVHAQRFFLPAGPTGPGYLSVCDGRVAGFGTDAPAGPVIDLGDSWVAPGFVDTHIHGWAGHDVMDCDADGFNELCAALVREGTTSWLATTLTASTEQTEEACASVAEALRRQGEGYLGTRTQGIFLEGPFFTEKFKGAQNPAYLCPPSLDKLHRWQDACGGIIRKSAFAAEYPEACAYATALAAEGVVGAIGHSAATYDEARAAVSAGASAFVHTYNGMSGLHHRDPGIVGCAMTTPATYSELICDGLHVHPAAVRALVNAKGWEHVFCVSDSLACGGMPEGDYVLGELPIRVVDGLARLVQPDGSLANIAGSTTTVAREVKNLVDWGVATPEQAVRMGTEVPARANGIGGVCGALLPGRAADFVALAPDMSLRATYLGGVEV